MGGALCVLRGDAGTTGYVGGVGLAIKTGERSDSVIISCSKAEKERKVWLCFTNVLLFPSVTGL